jgi:hypothetical protein
MSEESTIRVDAESGAPFVRNYTVLNNVDDSPDQYIALQYNEHNNSEYIKVTAKNHHPDKAINAYFYTLKEDGSGFIPGSWPDRTIKACLKPSESTVLRFEEKKHNPRMFLFNALFVDCE